jgi:hypothetical protein
VIAAACILSGQGLTVAFIQAQGRGARLLQRRGDNYREELSRMAVAEDGAFRKNGKSPKP